MIRIRFDKEGYTSGFSTLKVALFKRTCTSPQEIKFSLPLAPSKAPTRTHLASTKSNIRSDDVASDMILLRLLEPLI